MSLIKIYIELIIKKLKINIKQNRQQKLTCLRHMKYDDNDNAFIYCSEEEEDEEEGDRGQSLSSSTYS